MHKLPLVAREKGRSEEGGLARLPPGRHGLPAEFVTENQRGRIAAGMIEVTVAVGYPEATVTKVITAAGVSRRTFYNYYSNKADAFFDVYRQVTDFLCEAVADAGRGGGASWASRVRAELAALLGAYQANPDLVRFTLLAPQAAGGDAAAAYRGYLERLLALFGEGRPKRAKRPMPAAEYGLVGGLAGMLIAAVEEQEEPDLESMLPELTELALTPYLGRERAVAEARR
jgi:AcrR family transcriptional regulator